jgi:hypothetical protein
LRRAIQRLVENPLARRILAGEFPPGSIVRVDVAGDELTFESITDGGVAQPVEVGEAEATAAATGGDSAG